MPFSPCSFIKDEIISRIVIQPCWRVYLWQRFKQKTVYLLVKAQTWRKAPPSFGNRSSGLLPGFGWDGVLFGSGTNFSFSISSFNRSVPERATFSLYLQICSEIKHKKKKTPWKNNEGRSVHRWTKLSKMEVRSLCYGWSWCKMSPISSLTRLRFEPSPHFCWRVKVFKPRLLPGRRVIKKKQNVPF